jgi:hypothetical protein
MHFVERGVTLVRLRGQKALRSLLSTDSFELNPQWVESVDKGERFASSGLFCPLRSYVGFQVQNHDIRLCFVSYIELSV